MAGVNRPLTRRNGPWLNYVERISFISSESPTVYVVPITFPVGVNTQNNWGLASPTPLLSGTISQFTNGGALASPTPTLSGYFGGGGELVALVPVLSATMSIPVIMRGELVSPEPVLSGSGITGGLMAGGLMALTPTLSGYFGGGGGLASPAPTLSGSGIVGGVAGGSLVSPEPTLTGNITEESVMRGVLVSPSPVMAPSGYGWLVSPSPVMHAVMREVVAVTYEAYAINLTTGAVSHYTNYPFDNILRFGSSYYGISASGVYLLGGDLDLTVPIEAHIKTFATKLGTQNQKRVPYVYSSGRSDGGVVVGVTADEGVTYEYESDWGEVAGSTNHRTVVGKGIKGVYYAFDVKNTNGGSLELDEISVHVAPTQRAI